LAFIFASWRALLHGGAVWAVHDLICRKIAEFRPDRMYVDTLMSMRQRLYDEQMYEAEARLEMIGLAQAMQVRVGSS
jgi:hypothetical protein